LQRRFKAAGLASFPLLSFARWNQSLRHSPNSNRLL
jgi:hypothetical protein